MTSYTGTASASGWSWGATWTGGDDANEDEEDGEEYHGYVTGRDCLLLLVDCSAGMFESSGEDETAFELSIRCCKTVLLNKIISSDKDLVGVVFFGTDKHKNPSDFKHVFILQDLDLPDAPRIKQLDEFLEDSDLANTFQTEYGHNDAFSLSDVFWTCSNMFANMNLRAAHQRILLFTNNDNPHHSSLSLQRQAKTKAKDLADAGIELELMHIQHAAGRHFDLSLFYQDLLFTPDDDGSLPDASTKFEELLTRVRSKEYAQRTLQRIPLRLAPGLEIGIGVYCMVREAKKPSFVRLDRRSNEELKTQTKYLCDDTGNDLMKGDMKYYQMFGGEKVIFDKEEVDQMKKFDQPGLVLIGFKPRSRLKRHHYVKPANFIYPDETVIQGSSKLFTALLRQCLRREVIAICRYIPRTNASPIFVAMVPQDEERDDQGVQISPPGFNLIFIPFASDFRNLTIAETSKANAEQIDAAKDVIKKLTFPFDSESFENPVLQKHFRTLEAIALEQPDAEEVNDLTVPDAERIERRAGSLLEKFKELVYPSDYEVDKGTKRKGTSSAGGGKRAKISEGDDVNVEEHARNKTLNSLTIPILKNYLKSVGRKVAGKKQDLIDSINEHLGI